VRDDVRSYVLEFLCDPNAILALDETSFPKRGRKSAGVKKQYCGTTGRVENCQVGVFASYVSPKGHALIDRELYLPREWIQDRQRCQEAGIAETARFQTKCELAQRIVERLLKAGITIRWVVADTVYGGNLELRIWLEVHGYAYVLAVPCDEPLAIQTPDGRKWVEVRQVEALLLSGQDWQRLSMSEGTKGPRLFDWACVPILHQWHDDGRHWLLIRRCVEDPKEKAYYFVFGPRGTTLEEMVKAIGARWRVEEDFQTTKAMGLDQYEVRSWTGWYRHITLVMLAYAFLTGICAKAKAQASLSLPMPLEEVQVDSSLCTCANGRKLKLTHRCAISPSQHHHVLPSCQPEGAQVDSPLCTCANGRKLKLTHRCTIPPSQHHHVLPSCQPEGAQVDSPLCTCANGKKLKPIPHGTIAPSQHPHVVPSLHDEEAQANFEPLIALTVAEVRRVLGRLFFLPSCHADFVLGWSDWRRHHGWLASCYHTKRRLEAG
jgi:SRSO17 transposase